MASISYISAAELANLLKESSTEGKKKPVVVDVRDSDFVGGNIVGAIRAPSQQRTEQSTEELVKQLEDADQVIFHCVQSKFRGPKAARIYAEARQSLLEPAAPGEQPPTVQDSASAFEPNPYKSKTSSADADGSIDNSTNSPVVTGGPSQQQQPQPSQPPKQKRQEILVLQDGFENFQALYRNDPNLVEKFDESVWGSFAE